MVGLMLTAVCLWFFAARILEFWPSLRQAATRSGFLPWAAAALMLYLATFASSTGAWLVSLRLAGQRLDFLACARVNLLSQFAKFLPGNVAHHVGRVVLANQAGASTGHVAASILIDLVLLTAAGSVLALLNLDAADILLRSTGWLPSTSALALGALAAALVGLGAAFVLLRWVPALRMKLESAIALVRRLPPVKTAAAIGAALFYHGCSFALGSIAVVCLTKSIGGEVDVNFLPVLGAYSLAWLAGFVLPGAPAGIGVRDAVMLIALGPYIGEESATLVTALFRLVTTSGDGVAFLLGSALPKPVQA